MILEIKKGSNIALSQHFRSREFDCRCSYPDCNITYIDEELVNGLQALRLIHGPLIISSGFRCTRHNQDSGGKSGSFHLIGKAADITPSKKTTQLLMDRAKKIAIFRQGGIGYSPNFLHLDNRGYAARWTY